VADPLNKHGPQSINVAATGAYQAADFELRGVEYLVCYCASAFTVRLETPGGDQVEYPNLAGAYWEHFMGKGERLLFNVKLTAAGAATIPFKAS